MREQTIPQGLRLVSIDAVRGFAIVAMIIAHTVVFTRAVSPTWLLTIEGLLNDVASPLFALVMGATIALNTRLMRREGRSRFRLESAIKGMILVVAGFVLEFGFSGANIVLDYLGVTLLAGIPCFFLSSRALLIVIGALAAVGPFLNDWARSFVVASALPSGPLSTLADWTLTGESYRLTGLLPLFLTGIVVCRWALGNTRRTAMLAGLGLALLIAGYVLSRPYSANDSMVSGSYPDLVRDFGLALTAYASIAFLVDSPRVGVRRWSRRLFAPLTVQGRMALSIYVLHVLILIGIWASPLALGASPAWIGAPRGWVLTASVLLSCLAFAAVWSRLLGPGPIERVVGVAALRHPMDYLWARPSRALVPASAG